MTDSPRQRLTWLALIPRDTVFVRDGRSFDAAADATAVTVRPWPSTVAGAVGAAFGARPGARAQDLPENVLGPMLGRRVGASWDLYFPAPIDLVREADTGRPFVHRLTAAMTGSTTDLGDEVLGWLVPPSAAGPVKPVSGWMPGSLLADYLAGHLPGSGAPVSELELEDPLRSELRIGLARTPNRDVQAGYLYQASHLRPLDGWAFLAGCLLRRGWTRAPAGPVPLGGQGRLTDVETADTVGWPPEPSVFPHGKLLAYLATPAIWPGGWRIPLPEGAELVAAATGEPEAVATLSPGDGWAASRALRWAVPAGSVYLLKFPSEGQAADWAGRHHGTAYGLAREDRLRTAGFGVVLTGVWT